MKKTAALFILTILLSGYSCEKKIDLPLKPYSENPRYWEYKGKPVLFLGATDNHNLFQAHDMNEQIHTLLNAGGNYVRNTMSYREPGNVVPHFLGEDGKYDLSSWNKEYWKRFSDFLELTSQNNIIVQIEIWDRFDFSKRFWDRNPYNPGNNIHYSYEETRFEKEYNNPPEFDLQPFFHTIPGMPMYHPGLDKVRNYQEKYIDKILEHTLEYNHVLYAMNNETTSPVEWGKYWINYIRRQAESVGKVVFATDMFDHFFEPKACDDCLQAIHDPQNYPYLEISQINSRTTGMDHWEGLMFIMNEREKVTIRPANCTKVYGAYEPDMWWGFGSSKDGIERFCRSLIGGAAVVRHHRRPHGQGQSEPALGSLKAVRKIETMVRFWEVQPRMDLLLNADLNEAYLTAKEGENYVLYFPGEGSVIIDLTNYKYDFLLKWINVKNGDWGASETIEGGQPIELNTPSNEDWFAVIVRT